MVDDARAGYLELGRLSEDGDVGDALCREDARRLDHARVYALGQDDALHVRLGGDDQVVDELAHGFLQSVAGLAYGAYADASRRGAGTRPIMIVWMHARVARVAPGRREVFGWAARGACDRGPDGFARSFSMPISHGLPSGFVANRYDMVVVGAGYAGVAPWRATWRSARE